MLKFLTLIFGFCILGVFSSSFGVNDDGIPQGIPEEYKDLFAKVGKTIPFYPDAKGYPSGQGLWRESDIHGRFVIDHRLGNSSVEFEMNLLQNCANYNYAFNKPLEKQVKPRKAFLASLKAALNGKKTEAVKSTLTHHHCMDALQSCRAAIEPEIIVKMMKEYPEVMVLFLMLVPLVQDFSFMTPDLAVAIFADANAYLSPLKIPHFHETVSFDVISALLHRRGFNLCRDEAAMVIHNWSSTEAFKQLSDAEPRVWLLWKILLTSDPSTIPEFPLDLFLESFTKHDSPMTVYVNLMLAFIFDSEKRIWNAMKSLEFIHVDLHKNDYIENFYMDEGMISALDSRKWDIWHQSGKPLIEIISAVMAQKKRFIKYLESYSASIRNTQNHCLIHPLVILDNIIHLAKVPLPFLSRQSYLKSRDIDELVACADRYYSTVWHGPIYSPFAPMSDLLNVNYWTVLWKQLEILDVEFVYDESLTKYFENPTKDETSNTAYDIEDDSILNSLVVIHAVSKNSKIFCHSFWLAEIAHMTSGPMRDNLVSSEKYVRTLFGFLKNSVIDFSRVNLMFLKHFLHPQTSMDMIESLECADERFSRFRLAPSTLDREDISAMMSDPQMKKLMLVFREHAYRLRFLDAFSTEDLIEFFPVCSNIGLDTCRAIYTVDSDALAGFLFENQGAINFPDVLIWWIHPDAWQNSRLVDQIAPIINYYSFIRYEKEADKLGLYFVITDIVGRLERNENESVQVLIIKFLIQMEWIDSCFLNIPVQNDEKMSHIKNVIMKKFSGYKDQARGRLTNWLKEKKDTIEDGEELLKLTQRAPLSSSIANYILVNILFKQYALSCSSSKGNGNLQIITNYDKDPLYDFFRNAPKAYKISQTDLVRETKQSRELCEALLMKYFNPIEKQIALFRLRLMNALGENLYTINPLPALFAYHLFHLSALPLADLNVAYNVFNRLGLAAAVYINNRIGELKASPEATKIAKRLSEDVYSVRKILLTSDIASIKSLKK